MLFGCQEGTQIQLPQIQSSLCTIPGMKGRECRNKILNKKGKSPELDLSRGIMILEPHDLLLFFVSILFSYEKAEGLELVRW